MKPFSEVQVILHQPTSVVPDRYHINGIPTVYPRTDRDPRNVHLVRRGIVVQLVDRHHHRTPKEVDLVVTRRKLAIKSVTLVYLRNWLKISTRERKPYRYLYVR